MELQSDEFIVGWVGHVACAGEMGYAGTIIVREHNRRRALGIPVQNWEDNIKMEEIRGVRMWSR